MLLDEMNEVRNRIRVTLAHNLHNSDINFNIRLAEQEEIKPQMSRREILTHLQQENAAVNRLTTALGLELA
jgi:DNA polymerase-3 subunit gamma/tau